MRRPPLPPRLARAVAPAVAPASARVLLRVLGACALLVAAGCGGADSNPQLVAARFIDETPDAAPQEGESILLVFDRPVSLLRPSRTGLRLTPGGSAGAYTLRQGDRENTLSLALGAGDLQLVAAGLHGDPATPAATGVALELDRIEGLVGGDGRPLRGLTATVDLEVAPPAPALLGRATWEDSDRSVTVNQGDVLVLSFDRAVEPSRALRSQSLQLPADLVILPVAEDRLDDGRVRSRFESASAPARDTRIILGSAPRLTVQGEFDLDAIRFAGSPSGIAIDGTAIRPHPALHDRFGVGVASRQVIDLVGECAPFRPAPAFPHSGELTGHTATALPDGRVVIAGGWRRSERLRGPAAEVSDEVWVFDPAAPAGEEWRGPRRLQMPRTLHTATYFPGEDGELDTEDDFIILIGGYNGIRQVSLVEVILPNRGGTGLPETSILQPARGHPLPRFRHNAHSIPGENSVVVVGGHKLYSFLNRAIERIEIAFEGGLPSFFYVHLAGTLHLSRREHASALIDSPDGWLLLVFGGYGGEDHPNVDVELAEGRCAVLAHPEVLPIDLAAADLTEVPVAQILPDPGIGARRGARIVPLREETHPWLLAGGTDQPHLPGDEPSDRCRQVFRLDLLRVGDSRYELKLRPAGMLVEARHGLQAAALEDGRVLLIGGSVGFERSRTAELYNPLGGEFGAIEPVCRDLSSPRGNPDPIRGDFTVAPTSEGPFDRPRLLIVGGGESPEDGCEFFVPTE